jgi:ribonuclease HI
MNDQINIYCDGGARGNPGPAAAGFVVQYNGRTLHTSSNYLGTTTNNVAEYQAVILSLKWLLTNKTGLQQKLNSQQFSVSFFLDSILVVNQLLGSYKVKDLKLIKLYRSAIDLIKKLDLVFSFNHIPRSQNSHADALVNQALDSVVGE